MYFYMIRIYCINIHSDEKYKNTLCTLDMCDPRPDSDGGMCSTTTLEALPQQQIFYCLSSQNRFETTITTYFLFIIDKVLV